MINSFLQQFHTYKLMFCCFVLVDLKAVTGANRGPLGQVSCCPMLDKKNSKNIVIDRFVSVSVSQSIYIKLNMAQMLKAMGH